MSDDTISLPRLPAALRELTGAEPPDYGVVQNRVTREAGLALSGGLMAPCRFQVGWAYGSVWWRGGEAARR